MLRCWKMSLVWKTEYINPWYLSLLIPDLDAIEEELEHYISDIRLGINLLFGILLSRLPHQFLMTMANIKLSYTYPVTLQEISGEPFKFSEGSIPDFGSPWRTPIRDCTEMHAMKALLPFGSTYWCECAFSILLTTMKNNACNSLDA